jgi:hypothetical protein
MGLRGDVSRRLQELGYRRAGRMHLRPIDADFSSVVDTGPLDGFANDIDPWVGLRSEAVEHLRAALLELPVGDGVGSVGAFAYQILGVNYAPWRDPAALDEVLNHIDRAADALGRFASSERLADAWGPSGFAIPDPYTLVTIHLLRGDLPGVREWLDQGEREECAYDDEACEQFRTFERNVNARLLSSVTESAQLVTDKRLGPRPPKPTDDLSAAVVGFLGYGRSKAPVADHAFLDRQFGDRARRLADAVGELIQEIDAMEVDWTSNAFESATDHVVREIQRRHPDLSTEAARALGWKFSFDWR